MKAFANVRVVIADAGGVPTAGGGRMREGAVFRISGDLVGVPELAELEAAGLRRVIDLRGGGEDRSAIEGWARERGVVYRHHPMDVAGGAGLGDAIRAAVVSGRAEAYVQRTYRRIVSEFGGQIAATIGVLAEGFPAGFGCAAGKDRTGVVNALLQVLIGASEDDAADFYAARAPSLDRLRPLARDFFGYDHVDDLPPGVDHILGVQRSTMTEVFEQIREGWGGVKPYLEAHGLRPEQAGRLREHLVVTARPAPA